MKKETPILFSTPMVQAIIDNRKTKTRRTRGLNDFNKNPECWTFTYRGENLWSAKHKLSSVFELEFKCPYGQVGDLLWVRETFSPDYDGTHKLFWYKADFDKSDQQYLQNTWKPSIHMPKDACRLWLEIVSIKIECLNEISEEDAISEGITYWTEERLKSKPTHYKVYFQDDKSDPAFYTSCPIDSFKSLFQSINGEKSWKQNPWVWVIEFKKVEKP